MATQQIEDVEVAEADGQEVSSDAEDDFDDSGAG